VAVRAIAPVAGSPPEKRRENVGDSLTDQFHIWIVLVSAHAVGNDG